MARQISAVVAVAESTSAAKSMYLSPDDAASNMQNFAQFWKREAEKLEDMCRQHGEKPNLFFTVAPAEWKFPLHEGLLGDAKASKELGSEQTILTLH
eukprot:3590626-Karenia_brevis.AAC.1